MKTQQISMNSRRRMIEERNFNIKSKRKKRRDSRKRKIKESCSKISNITIGIKMIKKIIEMISSSRAIEVVVIKEVVNITTTIEIITMIETIMIEITIKIKIETIKEVRVMTIINPEVVEVAIKITKRRNNINKSLFPRDQFHSHKVKIANRKSQKKLKKEEITKITIVETTTTIEMIIINLIMAEVDKEVEVVDNMTIRDKVAEVVATVITIKEKRMTQIDTTLQVIHLKVKI